MAQVVYLVCGVPGSGKSWVCDQLKGFVYVSHDAFIGPKTGLSKAVGTAGLVAAVKEATKGKNPVVVDCPFGESELKAKLEAAGCEVEPLFIVETTAVIKERYRSRNGASRELPKASATRAESIKERAKEWGAKCGTSKEVLSMLEGKG